MSDTFGTFGVEFQLKIFNFLLVDRDFAAIIIDILEPEYFTNDNLQELLRLIKEYFDEYHLTPSFSILKTLVTTEISDEMTQLYLTQILEKIEDTTVVSERKFVEDKTLEFCKQQMVVNAVRKAIPYIENKDYDEVFSIVQHAIFAGTVRDMGHDYVDDAMARTMAVRNPVSTGFPLLDKYLAGGLGAKELGIVMAGTGVGKSMMLAWITAHAFKHGLNVIYYTLELSEDMVALRLDAAMSKIPLTSLLTDSEGIHREKVKKCIDNIHAGNPKPPKIVIKEYPTKTAGVNTLRNHISAWEQRDFKPDIICVDYADLLKPSTSYKDKRHELESVVEDLRGLAGELKIPIWTASQTNREGLDTSIVSLKAISESLAKAFVADIIVSVGKDTALNERDEACYYLAKSRFGKDKVIFTGKFDTSILDFSIDKEGLDSDEIVAANDEARNRKVSDAVREIMNKRGNGD